MFTTAIDPEYWSYENIPFYERESFTQPHMLLFIGLVILVVVLLVSVILKVTVVRRLDRTLYLAVVDDSEKKSRDQRGDLIENWKGGINFAIVISVLFVIFGFTNAGVRMAIASTTEPLTINSDGETRPEAFKSWLSDEYDIDVSESIAYRLDAPNLTSVMVEYQNESVVVKLVEDSANEGSFLLVREDNLEPLEPVER